LPGDASGSGEERRGGGEVLCSAGVAAPVRLGAAAREPFAFTDTKVVFLSFHCLFDYIWQFFSFVLKFKVF
jgi:hypothetical protein